MARYRRNNLYTVEPAHEESGIEVDVDVPPYRAATGPTYDCGGQPAEGGYPESWEVFQRVGGKRIRREDLDDDFDADDLMALIESSGACDEPDPDDEYERRREMREDREYDDAYAERAYSRGL